MWYCRTFKTDRLLGMPGQNLAFGISKAETAERGLFAGLYASVRSRFETL